jgi:hypothetical protein
MKMNKTKEFPWSRLEPPESGYRSILVDADSPWNFFWARRRGFGPCLLLRTNQKFEVEGRDLKGLDLELGSDGSAFLLSLVLVNELDSDVFEYFCRRLVEICSKCISEAEVVSALLLEIERWHDFLGRIRAGLSVEQRMGLFGELVFLQRVLEFNPTPLALDNWTGPQGGTRDFQFGYFDVEIKSVGKGKSRIRISSEFQLDNNDVDSLFLKVFTLCDSDHGMSISDLATSIFEILDPVAKLSFQSKLDSLGAVDLSRLDRDSWIVCDEVTFRIDDEFPSIRRSEISDAISSVQYRLNIKGLDRFAIENDVLELMIGDDVSE